MDGMMKVEPMARRRRKRNRASLRRRRAAHLQKLFRSIGRLLFLATLIGAATAALTIFFKVDTIEVTGSSRYDAAELKAGLSIRKEDNLFLWNKIKDGEALLEKFPYLDTVEIRRELPDTIIVTVTETTAVLAVLSDTGYFLVNERGKVLEQSADTQGLPVAFGVSLLGYHPGQTVTHTSDAFADALLTVLEALHAEDMLADVDFVNLQSLTDIRVGYGGRFDIRFGTVDRMAYKAQYVNRVITERLSPSDIGRLYWDNRDRLHFVPDTAENVAKSGQMHLPADLADSTNSGDSTTNPDDTPQTQTPANGDDSPANSDATEAANTEPSGDEGGGVDEGSNDGSNDGSDEGDDEGDDSGDEGDYNSDNGYDGDDYNNDEGDSSNDDGEAE